MNRRLFFRCNGGHYFQGARCPFDGWTMDGVGDAVERFLELEREGREPTLAALKVFVRDPELLGRMLVVEFGAEASAFEALVPERYLVNGAEVLWKDTGNELN